MNTDPRYVKAVAQVYDWQHGGTSFYCKLFDLFQKADSENRARLTIAFPIQARALDDWGKAGDYGNDLFKEHGIGRS